MCQIYDFPDQKKTTEYKLRDHQDEPLSFSVHGEVIFSSVSDMQDFADGNISVDDIEKGPEVLRIIVEEWLIAKVLDHE